ncbi:S4 domain protein [Cooperia oncophora]
MKSCIVSVKAVSFYRGTVSSGMKVHISTGFETIMAECQFLRPDGGEFEQLASLEEPCVCWLTFDRPVYTRSNAFYIASKLDHQGRGCRFLFHGHFEEFLKVPKVQRFVRRVRIGRAERVENTRSIVCNSLFKKETKISLFEGMPVSLSTGEKGRVVGAFGKGGKARIEMTVPLADDTVEKIGAGEVVEVRMHLKKYLGEKKFHGVMNRLTAAVRWHSAQCRFIHPSILARSQELGDDGLPKDYKLKTLKAGSRRLDTFVNRASGKEQQVEKLILGGRVRVNEDVHTKKSYNVCMFPLLYFHMTI